MSLSRARADYKRFSQGEFSEEIVFTTPDGLTTVTVRGLVSRHNLSINPETGEAVNSLNAHVSVAESVLNDAGYTTRDAKKRLSLSRHKVSWIDANSINRTYLIDSAMPSDTLGYIVITLGSMPVKITTQIPASNFELIRDRIGEIITLELSGQTFATALGVNVWQERSIPFNAEELPAVSVSYGTSDFSNQNALSALTDNEFYIDIHASSPHQSSISGDEKAAKDVVRLAGIIWHIISAQEYRTLGFAPGVIGHRSISNIRIGRLSNQDALHTIAARVTVKVNSIESVNQVVGVEGSIFTTQVKLNTTDKGYLWEYEKS